MPSIVEVNISGVLGKISQFFGNPARTPLENPEREKDRYFERFCILWEKLNVFLLIVMGYSRNTQRTACFRWRIVTGYDYFGLEQDKLEQALQRVKKNFKVYF